MKKDRDIVEENEWYRCYSTSSYPSIYESKFATGEARISLDDLEARWKQWNEGERIQFAQAFGFKHSLDPQEVAILEFLLDQTDTRILTVIADIAAQHPDRGRAARFLTHCLHAIPENRGNFLHGLFVLADANTLPDLQGMFRECGKKITMNGNDHEAFTALLHSAAAIFRITGEVRYLEIIKKYREHPHTSVCTRAKLYLDELDQPGGFKRMGSA